MNAPDESLEELQNGQDGLPAVAPDFVEEEICLDDIVPTSGYDLAPMVGLGGSAGSIAALGEFFKAMPADSGMVFVVVLHLSPTHESTMAELLARSTAMNVVQAVHGQQVEPNHVYVIPPGKYLTALNGHLKLTQLENDRGTRVAVDLFFRSLADSHGPHSAAIILSGADGDGALGIKRVKERGGLTIAQDPAQAEYPSMPRSAIETGMVDWVLQVGEMPGRLLEYRDNDVRAALPPEEGPQPLLVRPLGADEGEAALRDVLIFLRMRTGRDFSYYKRATILRRIGRRMQVNSVENLQEYLSFMRTHRGEAGALLQDLLISVTNFFRDREAFAAVERQIPKLFQGKTHSDSVRVWVPACATGEEAYSFAMLLREHARTLDGPPALQVIACDLDDDAIQYARAGHYPAVITADVSEQRLTEFFVKDHRGYRVRRELREMVLFASHDLLKDAPFSRMDLISCRNLLIYLSRDAQRRALDLFHFALKPEGRLFLGSSESVEEDNRTFRVLDKKHRIYESCPVHRVGLPLSGGAPSAMLRAIQVQERQEAPVVHGKGFVREAAAPFFRDADERLDRGTLADLHFRLLELLGPPSVVVDSDYEILHLSEHAGAFLKLSGGQPTMNLLRVVHPDLRTELRTALFRAGESQSEVYASPVSIEADSDRRAIQMRVAPASDVAEGLFLVAFEEWAGESTAGPALALRSTDADPAIEHLERELEKVKLNLRYTVEQYEASTEELKASNEELQAMNEELRSATEELETSREELQSINEELTTVNQEMKGKMEELALANSDLQNLMSSTSIATIFLDRELAITRYTPTAVELFHLIPSDLGRPLSDLKHQLDYADLIADAKDVLRTLQPAEREVRDENRWFLARMQPYRTLEDRIAGVVLTFIDVTDRKEATEASRHSEEHLRMVLESAKEYAILTFNRDRMVNSWNSGARLMFGYDEQEILGESSDVLFTPEDQAEGAPEREVQRAHDDGRAENERWHARKDGSTFYGSGSVMPLRDSSGELVGYLKIMRDLTANKRAQEALNVRVDELSQSVAGTIGREQKLVGMMKEMNDLRGPADPGPNTGRP